MLLISASEVPRRVRCADHQFPRCKMPGPRFPVTTPGLETLPFKDVTQLNMGKIERILKTFEEVDSLSVPAVLSRALCALRTCFQLRVSSRS